MTNIKKAKISRSIKTQEILNIDAVAYPLSQDDFEGIQSFMTHLFIGASTDFNSIVELILSQSNIGSVLRQVFDDPSDEEESDDDTDDDFALALITAVNLKHKESCLEDLASFLISKAPNTVRTQFVSYLKGNVGLVISERLANIPAISAPPMWDSLGQELKEVAKSSSSYDFDNLLYVTQSVYVETESKTTRVFKKPEDLEILKDALVEYDYSVAEHGQSTFESDDEGDDDNPKSVSIPYRTVMLLPSSILSTVSDRMKAFIVSNVNPSR